MYEKNQFASLESAVPPTRLSHITDEWSDTMWLPDTDRGKKMSIFDGRNLSMMMDLYEMTMSNGYFLEAHRDDMATFDVFFRRIPDSGGYAIFAGLEQIVDFIEHMRFDEADIEYLRSLKMFDDRFLDYLSNYRFTGDVDAFDEGTIMYPNEPVVTVTAPMIDAQLVETAILAQFNHQSLIATKARRIVRAAQGRAVSDFGARRAHNMDAAVYGARAAYIGGVVGTATVLSGQMFGIPVSGTMAHSWVMYHDSEFEAFRKYAEIYPDDTVLLIDTYDVLRSGTPNAIRCAREVLEPMGKRLKGVRLDSGDLAYLTKEVRRMLDDAGLQDCRIIASNSLDEYSITSIIDQGARIDSFGVGERLITAKSDPVLGAVYKIAAVRKDGVSRPTIKVSEAVEKITNPGRKKVYRVYDGTGHAVCDLITLEDEEVDLTKPYRAVDPVKPWKEIYLVDCTARELLHPVIRNGRRVSPTRDLKEIRDYVDRQLREEIWQEEQRFENPHVHHMDMSPAYYEFKMDLLRKADESSDRCRHPRVGMRIESPGRDTSPDGLLSVLDGAVAHLEGLDVEVQELRGHLRLQSLEEVLLHEGEVLHGCDCSDHDGVGRHRLARLDRQLGRVQGHEIGVDVPDGTDQLIDVRVLLEPCGDHRREHRVEVHQDRCVPVAQGQVPDCLGGLEAHDQVGAPVGLQGADDIVPEADCREDASSPLSHSVDLAHGHLVASVHGRVPEDH